MEQTQEKKKGKGGRPPKAIRKEICTGVRFTKTEYFIVREKAIKAGLRYTVYVRQMALFGGVIARLSNDERTYIKQLIGMANNINQVSKQAHKEGMLNAMLLFESYRKQIDRLLNRLRRDK
ncbi:plasmid mobilization protein [Chitinophaga filiformis]|uniref:MobC family plasmid mobilization relaxosome protein n=1 Tax=Chitinophaga filiformis TaxID=104663 RepID=A0ABY4IDY6_CHIFI|nr:plasmid mobilization relaxosome protein MobC [Chitinophaga filiformis]UPK72856.1 MobC family plasmid mobilization relaxosome protein [Chitinophaga filiformis]